MSQKLDIVDEALKPAERKVYHDKHDDGLRILDLLLSNRPEHLPIIAQLNKECPYDYSVDTRTGKHIPTTAHTIAAWAMNTPAVVHRMKMRNLI